MVSASLQYGHFINSAHPFSLMYSPFLQNDDFILTESPQAQDFCYNSPVFPIFVPISIDEDHLCLIIADNNIQSMLFKRRTKHEPYTLCFCEKNIVLGEGIPKICIPLVSTCLDALLNDMKKALDHSADLIEWRVDWMDDILKKGYLEEILPAVRKAAGDTPLLFTFRTKKEGGNMAASLLQYKELVKRAICSGLVDLVDIELFSDKDTVNELIALAKEKM